MTDSSNVNVDEIANRFLEDIINNDIRPQLVNRRFQFQSPSLTSSQSYQSIYDIFSETPIENLILNSYESHLLEHSHSEAEPSIDTNTTIDINTTIDTSNNTTPHTTPSINPLTTPLPTARQIPSIFNILNSSLGTTYREIPRISELINNSLYEDTSMYKKVLSETGIKSLIKIPFKEALKKEEYTNINKTCPIMQTDFEEEEEITILPCKHAFQTEAIERWLKEEKSQCPICRYELDSVEEKINPTTPTPTPAPTPTEVEPTTTNTTSPEPNQVRANLENILFSTYNRNPSISRLQRRNRRLYEISPPPQTIRSVRRRLFPTLESTMNRMIENDSNDILQQAILESIQQQNQTQPQSADEEAEPSTTPITPSSTTRPDTADTSDTSDTPSTP